MIRFNVELSKDMKNLVKELEKFQDFVEEKREDTILELYKTTNALYVQAIEQYVYALYIPMDYDRTGHIMGEHGARDEIADPKRYIFTIDENSTDPVDGMTWRDKADNLEKGSTRMFGNQNPMPDRPFIDETQNILVEHNKVMAKLFYNAVMGRLNKITKGGGN